MSLTVTMLSGVQHPKTYFILNFPAKALCSRLESCLNNWLVIALAGACAADGLGSEFDLALEIDAFTALRTDHALTFIAGKLFRRQFHMNGLSLKKLLVRHLAIGQHLLLVFVFNF